MPHTTTIETNDLTSVMSLARKRIEEIDRRVPKLAPNQRQRRSMYRVERENLTRFLEQATPSHDEYVDQLCDRLMARVNA